MDTYQAEHWYDFFLAAAGAAALLFVALSLQDWHVATDPTYRQIARGSHIGLVIALPLSLLLLVRQPIVLSGASDNVVFAHSRVAVRTLGGAASVVAEASRQDSCC